VSLAVADIPSGAGERSKEGDTERTDHPCSLRESRCHECTGMEHGGIAGGNLQGNEIGEEPESDAIREPAQRGCLNSELDHPNCSDYYRNLDCEGRMDRSSFAEADQVDDRRLVCHHRPSTVDLGMKRGFFSS
jgi:hypothetical protein